MLTELSSIASEKSAPIELTMKNANHYSIMEQHNLAPYSRIDQEVWFLLSKVMHPISTNRRHGVEWESIILF